MPMNEAATIKKEADVPDSLLNRLTAYVDRFEKVNPNPAVRAQHREFLLLKECLGVVEAMVEFIDEEDCNG